VRAVSVASCYAFLPALRLCEAVPLIYVGTDRSLRRQRPSQQYSLLRRIFEDINEDFQNRENKVVVRDREGNEREVARIERLEQLLKLVMNLLKKCSR